MGRPCKEMADSRFGSATNATMEDEKEKTEVPEEAPDKESDEPDKPTVGGGKNNYCPYSNGKANTNIVGTSNSSISNSRSTHDSRSNTTNTVSCSSNGGIRSSPGCTGTTSSTSSGGVTSLGSGGLGNPFARQPATPTWGNDRSTGNDTADSKRILAPSRLGSHADTGNSTAPSVLRPSALGSGGQGGGCGATTRTINSNLFNSSSNSQSGSNTNKSIFKLKPSVLGGNNPFAKAPVENEDESSALADSSTAPTEPTAATSAVSNSDLETPVQTEEKSSENNSVNTTSSFGSRLNTTSSSSQLISSPSRNIFMPLARNGEENSEERLKSPRANEPQTTGTGFVFGSNIHNKVTGAESAPSATNGENSTGNLFSDAAKKNSNDTVDDGVWGGGKSLDESSREITERENANKRKFDEVEVITGEEAESNVLQMNCKLYAWINGTWQERGRGLLRLNDWDAQGELHSRLVIRTQGTLTVMLNTKVWSEMSVERASPKSVRFTALETDGQPKIFLVQGSPKDIDLLYNSLEWRVATSRSHIQDDIDTKKTKLDEGEVPPLNV